MDVYNGQITGEVAASVTSATGISNATGPKVCSWNGDITPKSAEEVSVTLRSQQGGEGTGVAMPMMVRRLTPMEACRLMAWEDDRLDLRHEVELLGNRWVQTGKVVEQKDSAKYKQAGNGVASNCSEWIARRMRHVMEG